MYRLINVGLVRFMAKPCVIHPDKHLIDSEDGPQGLGRAASRLYSVSHSGSSETP